MVSSKLGLIGWLPCLLVSGLFLTAHGETPNAIPKNGVCPSGYHTEGRYCVGNRHSPPPDALLKNGVCPSGYHSEGRYCVGNHR